MDTLLTSQGLVIAEPEFYLTRPFFKTGSNAGRQSLDQLGQNAGSNDATARTCVQNGEGAMVLTHMKDGRVSVAHHLRLPEGCGG